MLEEKYIEEVLKSTEGMSSALAPDELYSKIQHKIQQKETKEFKLNTFQISWMVAAVILLVGLNVALVSKHIKNEKLASKQSLSKEYGFSTDDLMMQ
jgi:hypothetical protein